MDHSGDDDNGNSAGHGTIAARILINKAGVATLEIRTGIFDNATNKATPNGYFDKIEYTVTNPANKNKKVFDRTIEFKKTTPSVFSEVINLCNNDDDDDSGGNNDGHGGWSWASWWPSPPCQIQFSSTYVVTIQANLKGVALDGKRTDVVRGAAGVFNSPDLDLSLSKISMLIPGPPPFLADLGLVQKGTSQTYDVTFNNLGPAPRAIGSWATCEVHVFRGAIDVTPAGRTYRWIPDGRASYDATKPGSAVSDTTTILPGDNATCEFTMTLADTGSYRIEVTAASAYPGDYDPSNNKVSGIVRIITGSPSTPPPDNGGPGANAIANEFTYFGDTVPGTGGAKFSPFLGLSGQSAHIDSLSTKVIDGNGITGTFTLKMQISTVDGTPNAPTATRNLGSSVWTGPLPALIAAVNAAPDHCVASTTLGTVTVSYAKNGDVLTATICMVPVGVNYNTTVNLSWGPPSLPPTPISVADGATPFGDYLIWDSDLSFTNLVTNPVSHAPVSVPNHTGAYFATGLPFGAKVQVRNFR